MKRLILIIAASLLLTACVENIPAINSKIISGGIVVETIDGCEYIKSNQQGGHYTYTHKGNCQSCQANLDSIVFKAAYRGSEKFFTEQ